MSTATVPKCSKNRSGGREGRKTGSELNMLRRWMLFIDGENLTCRGQDFASREGLALQAGEYWKKDCFLWMPGLRPLKRPDFGKGEGETLQPDGIRAYYYTSVVGDESVLAGVQESLWKIGFTPKVFKKQKERKSKGVDISLTTDMLTHAFQNHFDTAILMAGDGDYGPLVGRVKSLGKILLVWFFGDEKDGLSPALRLSSDLMLPLDAHFVKHWPHQASIATSSASTHPAKEPEPA
jgi:NYN domain